MRALLSGRIGIESFRDTASIDSSFNNRQHVQEYMRTRVKWTSPDMIKVAFFRLVALDYWGKAPPWMIFLVPPNQN